MLMSLLFNVTFFWIWHNKTEVTPRTVLFVPEVLKETLIKEVYGQLLTGHDGILKTKERLQESYF